MSLVAAKAGYLDVKTPAKSRGIRMLKAWKKRWVVISSKELHPPSLVIQVYGDDSLPHKDKSCLFSKTINAENASVYRSRSRSHKYAFSIAEDCNPVLHMGGNSESQSQEWMACMRDLLWPPTPIKQTNTVLNGKWRVSLIDNEFSFKAGMLGLYGNLAVTRDKLVITAPRTGHAIKEWQLSSIQRYQLVPQTCREDSDKVFSITVCNSTGLSDQLQFFSIHSVSIIESISKTLEQYQHSFESLLDSHINEDCDLIQFEDDFLKTEVATTDDEVDVRISLNSSGSSTATSCSDGPLPLCLISLPDNMLDCSITSPNITQESETQAYSPPSSPRFSYDNLDYYLSAEFESSLEDGGRYSSISSHIYSSISSHPSSRKQSQTDSIYEEIEKYQDTEKEEYQPPLPPRNNPTVCKEINLEESDCILLRHQQVDHIVSRKVFARKAKSKLDLFLDKVSLNRTKSTPTIHVSADYQQEINQPISRSAPNEPLCLPFPTEYNDMGCKSAISNKFSESQLLPQSLKIRQRSITYPSSKDELKELELLVAELNNSEPKHRKFRQCLKTLSESNLLESDFSFSTESCAELFSEFKTFSSDYCNMNSLVDTPENQNKEFECRESDYVDMKGINSYITSIIYS